MWCVYTHTHTHTHTLEYYSAIKINEILSFAAPWMDLENIMLSEIKSENINTLCYHSYVESKNNTTELIYKTETDS